MSDFQHQQAANSDPVGSCVERILLLVVTAVFVLLVVLAAVGGL